VKSIPHAGPQDIIRAVLELWSTYDRADGVAAVERVWSLSVEQDNCAWRLYKEAGFRTIGRPDDTWTMMVELNTRESAVK